MFANHYIFIYSGRWKKKKKKKKNELHLLACSAALGPSGRGHRPKGDAITIFFLLVMRGACQRPDLGIHTKYDRFWPINQYFSMKPTLYER